MTQSLQLNEIRLGHKQIKDKERMMDEYLPDLSELPSPEMLKTFVECIGHDLDSTFEYAKSIEDYSAKYEFSICPRLDVELFSYLCAAKVHMHRLDDILETIANKIDNLPEPSRYS